MEKGIEFLNDEVEDCAKHFFEKECEHDDIAAKLATSEGRMKEVEQMLEISQTELGKMVKKQKVRWCPHIVARKDGEGEG